MNGRLTFDNSYAAIDAPVNSYGIADAPENIVERHIASGLLVRFRTTGRPPSTAISCTIQAAAGTSLPSNSSSGLAALGSPAPISIAPHPVAGRSASLRVAMRCAIGWWWTMVSAPKTSPRGRT